MCDPLIATSIALPILSGGTGLLSNNFAEEAKAKEYARVAEENTQIAGMEFTEKSANERVQEMQENTARAEETMKLKHEAMQKEGTAMASTALGGQGLTTLMNDYTRQKSQSKNTLRKQAEMAKVGHETNINSYKMNAQNTINTQQQYVSTSDPVLDGIGTALQIGGGIFKNLT